MDNTGRERACLKPWNVWFYNFDMLTIRKQDILYSTLKWFIHMHQTSAHQSYLLGTMECGFHKYYSVGWLLITPPALLTAVAVRKIFDTLGYFLLNFHGYNSQAGQRDIRKIVSPHMEKPMSANDDHLVSSLNKAWSLNKSCRNVTRIKETTHRSTQEPHSPVQLYPSP